jgi:hypothetical protein
MGKLMKKSLYGLFCMMLLVFIISCNDNDDNSKISYAGQWTRSSHAFNGSVGIDTVAITQIGDSIYIKDADIIDTACIKNDTIFVSLANSFIGLKYFVIQSNHQFRSNYPINRCIDSIVLKKQ